MHFDHKHNLVPISSKPTNGTAEIVMVADAKTGTAEIIACDGSRALAVVPVSPDATDYVASEARIPHAAIVAARKLRFGRSSPVTVRVDADDKTVSTVDGTRFPAALTVRPVSTYRTIIDDVQRKPGEHRIAFDLRILAQVAEALGTDNVSLTFGEANAPILVRPVLDDGNQAYGIVMPISAD